MSLQQEAERLLDEMVRGNLLPTGNVMMIAVCSEGRRDVLYYLLHKLVVYGCEPSVLAYDNVIKCLRRQKRMDDARTPFSLMRSRGFSPDMSTQFNYGNHTL
jgi:pentatricopeptide repeat protein